MTPILSYLLKANIVLAMLYGFYFLFFRRDTFYGYIRWYLLAVIASVVLFPMVDISGWLASTPTAIEVAQYVPDMGAVFQYVLAPSQIILTQPPPMEYTAEPAVAHTISLSLILLWCWLPVTVFMIGKRVFQLAYIFRLWYCYPQKSHGNSAIIAVDKNIQPFSFFRRIFLNPALYSENEADEIVAHEQIHCLQRHTIDNLLAEAVVCLCWFNPAAWLLRRDLKQNLEYYTDRKTLLSGFDRKHYQYSLLRLSGNAFQIVNHFHFNIHHLKKRIIMINKKHSPRILTTKYLLVVPALAATLLLVQMSGLQAAEKYLNDNASTPVEQTELPDFHIVEDVFLAQKETTNSTVEKTVSVFADTSITKKEEYPRVILYGRPSAEMSHNSNVIKYQAKDSVAFHWNTPSSSEETFNGKDSSLNVISQPFRIRELEDVTAINRPLPLIIHDWKIISIEEMSKIVPATIQSVSILKAKAATDLFGEKAKEGVIIIQSKMGTNPAGEQESAENEEIESKDNIAKIISSQPFQSDDTPLYIVDGKEVDNLDHLSAESIHSISVLKDHASTTLFGEKGKNGVILITTKK